MDDGLGGSDSLNIAMETKKELIIILKKHGFSLRKWSSNSPRLLKDIPYSDREVNLDFDESKSIKTLGLFWMPQADHFCVKANIDHCQVITKRSVTSELAKLFDPLGLLAPIVVKAKMFIQQLWQLALGWDEPLPKNFVLPGKHFEASWNVSAISKYHDMYSVGRFRQRCNYMCLPMRRRKRLALLYTFALLQRMVS